MSASLATVAEQIGLVAADQIAEARLLAGLLVGRLDASVSRAWSRAICACYDFGIIPRCARCGELIHEPEPIVAGRCPRCDNVVDCAADGQVDLLQTELAEPARVNGQARPLDHAGHAGVSCGAQLFGDGGGI